MKCKHEFRPTTNNGGATDGMVCIKCLVWKSWDNRFELLEN